MKNVYNTYIWLYNVQMFVVKKQRRTMLYKSAHHLELAVQGIIKPKKIPHPPNRIIGKKLIKTNLYHSRIC